MLGAAGGGAATGKMHDSRGDRREHRKQKCKRLAGILREPSDISRFSGMAEGELKNVLSRAKPASSASPLACLSTFWKIRPQTVTRKFGFPAAVPVGCAICCRIRVRCLQAV